ncbi:hypothetical protein D3C80_1455380 [compost metagenome]
MLSQLFIFLSGDRSKQCIQAGKAGFLHLKRNVILHAGSRRAFTRRIQEGICRIEADLLYQRQRILELLLCLAWEADNNVCCQHNIWNRFFDLVNKLQKNLASILSAHSLQNLGTSRLNRQMNVLNQIPPSCQHLNQMVIEIPWMTRHKSNPGNIDFRHILHKIAEAIRDILEILAVGIYILTKQRNFLKALAG